MHEVLKNFNKKIPSAGIWFFDRRDSMRTKVQFDSWTLFQSKVKLWSSLTSCLSFETTCCSFTCICNIFCALLQMRWWAFLCRYGAQVSTLMNRIMCVHRMMDHEKILQYISLYTDNRHRFPQWRHPIQGVVAKQSN